MPSDLAALVRDTLRLPEQLAVQIAELDGGLDVRIEVPELGTLVLCVEPATSDGAWLRGPELQVLVADGTAPSLLRDRRGQRLLHHLARRMKGAPVSRGGGSAAVLRRRLQGSERGQAATSFAGAAAPFEAAGGSIYAHAAGGDEHHIGVLRLGFRCNQACYFCWQGRDWPDADRARHFDDLRSLAEQGLSDLMITGGEPTLFKHLPELVATAIRDHGLRVHLQTNAVRLARASYTAQLVEAGLTSAMVSLHSHDPEVSDRMTSAPGTHAQTVAGLRTALAAGVAVHLNCVVEQANHEGLAAHARFVVDELATPFPDNPLRSVSYSQPSAYHLDAPYVGAQVPLDLVRPHLSAAVAILLDAGLEVETEGGCSFPPCAYADTPEVLVEADPASYAASESGSRCFVEACEGCARRAVCLGVRRDYVARWGSRGVVPFDTLGP